MEASWRDIQIFMLGKPVAGARGIQYEAVQSTEHVHGLGADPLGVARGQKTYTGSITMLQSEVEALQAAVGRGNDLLDIQPFDISVSYLIGARVVTDRLRGVVFNNLPKEMDAETTFMEVTCDLTITKIEYNV